MGVPFLTQYRNPLAYPAGVAPGFDPGHVAARNTRFSGVAYAGGVINVQKGAPPSTITGTPTAGIDGVIGSYASHTSTASHDFDGLSIANDIPSFTFATILQVNTLGGAANNIYLNSVAYGTGGIAFYLSTTGELKADNPGPYQTIASGLTLAVDIPYFIIFMGRTSGASGASVLVKNLRTGVVAKSGLFTNFSASTAPSGTHRVGNSTTAQPARSRIAAVMFSGSILSDAAAEMWADDPWPFWYPNPGDNWIAAQAAAGFPYWGVQNNNFVIGTGVQ